MLKPILMMWSTADGANGRLFRTVLLSGLLLVNVAGIALADAWPTYRHDIARSGLSAAEITLPLKAAWTYQSPYPPQPAWAGPARRDGWHKTENLKPRVTVDWSFHVVGADNRVYFGSSVNDKVYCLDAQTGEERWAYFTDGPIRLAPSIYGDKIYAGSDDGRVYCLNATTGELIWKQRVGPVDNRVSGNDRMISVWPVRTGVLVDNGIAYCGAGLFPNEGVYLAAYEAETGKEIWKHKIGNNAAQGYILASASKLYVPTGGGSPAVFDRRTGEYIQNLGGAGGSFCLLTEDSVIYGPGRTGTLDAFTTETEDHYATFAGNVMVVNAGRSYMHTDIDLTALDRTRFNQLAMDGMKVTREEETLKKELKRLGDNVDSEQGRELRKKLETVQEQRAEIEKQKLGCFLWRRDCRYPYSLIQAGNRLFAGGNGEVAAIDTDTGETVWTGPVNGHALEMALSDGRLIVSTDRGTIHGFAAE